MADNLLVDKHIDYIKGLGQCSPSLFLSDVAEKGRIEYWRTEHLRLNGVYWGHTATCLVSYPQTLD